MTSLIYDKRHFELATGDVIMNIAVSFSLHFAENMLNMSQSNHIFYNFSSIFLPLHDLFT